VLLQQILAVMGQQTPGPGAYETATARDAVLRRPPVASVKLPRAASLRQGTPGPGACALIASSTVLTSSLTTHNHYICVL